MNCLICVNHNYNLFKYSSALGIAFPLVECYHILLLQNPAAEEYENQ